VKILLFRFSQIVRFCEVLSPFLRFDCQLKFAAPPRWTKISKANFSKADISWATYAERICHLLLVYVEKWLRILFRNAVKIQSHLGFICGFLLNLNTQAFCPIIAFINSLSSSSSSSKSGSGKWRNVYSNIGCCSSAVCSAVLCCMKIPYSVKCKLFSVNLQETVLTCDSLSGASIL